MLNYKFDHIHLHSPEPQKTAEFYEKTFGAKQTSIHEMGDGRIIVNLDLSGITVLISQSFDEPLQTGLDHFGIRTDDIGAAINELKARGVTFTLEMTEIRPDFKISYFAAPDNVRIELQEGGL